MSADTLPLMLHAGATVLVLAVLLLAARWLGRGRHQGGDRARAYESGMEPGGSARRPMTVPFYLVAIIFIVFDVEGAFILTWGVAWDLLGVPGMVHITIFIVTLLAGLVWLWRKGGLEWGPSRSRNAAFPPSRR